MEDDTKKGIGKRIAAGAMGLAAAAGMIYGALRSYENQPQENEIKFLNKKSDP